MAVATLPPPTPHVQLASRNELRANYNIRVEYRSQYFLGSNHNPHIELCDEKLFEDVRAATVENDVPTGLVRRTLEVLAVLTRLGVPTETIDVFSDGDNAVGIVAWNAEKPGRLVRLIVDDEHDLYMSVTVGTEVSFFEPRYEDFGEVVESNADFLL